MQIQFGDSGYQFSPWRPDFGAVFNQTFAFDVETALIDEYRPWLTPPYVIGAAFDGQRGYFVQRDHAAEFLARHRALPVIFHNAPFDVAVLDKLAPELLIYEQVDADLVTMDPENWTRK